MPGLCVKINKALKMKQETPKVYAVMVEGQQQPSIIHKNYESAEQEAMRLAIKLNKTAYVMAAIAKIEIQEPLVFYTN